MRAWSLADRQTQGRPTDHQFWGSAAALEDFFDGWDGCVGCGGGPVLFFGRLDIKPATDNQKGAIVVRSSLMPQGTPRRMVMGWEVMMMSSLVPLQKICHRQRLGYRGHSCGRGLFVLTEELNSSNKLE